MADLKKLDTTWKEITRQLQTPLNPATRASWQGNHTSFDYDEILKYLLVADDQNVQPATIARIAGYILVLKVIVLFIPLVRISCRIILA